MMSVAIYILYWSYPSLAGPQVSVRGMGALSQCFHSLVTGLGSKLRRHLASLAASSQNCWYWATCLVMTDWFIAWSVLQRGWIIVELLNWKLSAKVMLASLSKSGMSTAWPSQFVTMLMKLP